jgi:hypothetical protein
VVSSFAPLCPSTMMFLPHHKPKNDGTSQPWTETSKTGQNKSFLP